VRKGLSEKSIKNLRTTLHTILVYAVKWGYLDRLPELPQVRVPEASLTGISQGRQRGSSRAPRTSGRGQSWCFRCTRTREWASSGRSEVGRRLQGRGTARVLQGRRRQAVTRAVPRDLGGGAETVGPSPDQMARAAALVRVDPDDGRGTTSDSAVPAWSLVDQDDGALRASGSGAERSLRSPALRSRAAASLDGRSGKCAPGGPETTVTA